MLVNNDSNIIGENQTQENEGSNLEENETNDNIKEDVKEGIYVPKQRIRIIDPNVEACRVATLVYKGRIYTIEGTEISLEEGKVLMDKKLGVT